MTMARDQGGATHLFHRDPDALIIDASLPAAGIMARGVLLALLACCAATEGALCRETLLPRLSGANGRLCPPRAPRIAGGARRGAGAALSGGAYNSEDEIRVITPLEPRHFADYARGNLSPARIRCANCTCGYTERCYALCNSNKAVRLGSAAGWDQVKLTIYFACWYVLSILHSVSNKRVTNVLPLPWSVATAQLVVGAVFAQLLWATRLRAPPTLLPGATRALLPIGAFHGIGHIAGVVGTSAGSVSFAQVVKSAGPVYACVLSSLVLRQSVSLKVISSHDESSHQGVCLMC